MARTFPTLNVKLQVINNADSHPLRVFTLTAPFYAIRVGRGSKSGSKELFPDRHNAWFESRVMSREHAMFKADPESKHVYIEDISSMHGTYVEGRKIRSRGRETLFEGDLIRFGAEVTRGPESFPPLEVIVTFEWIEEIPLCVPNIPNAPKMSYSQLPGMTFTCPEFIEDDSEEENEVEFLHESFRGRKIEALTPSRAYAVPESDVSCAGSFTSEGASSEPRTPETSALISLPTTISGPSGLSEAEKRADEKALSLYDSSPNPRSTSSRAYSAADLFRAVNDEKLDSQKSELLNKSQDSDQAPISMTPTQDKDKTAFDNDLTESDSGSDDGYSPGLWVDESEGEAHDDEDRRIAEDSHPKADNENEIKNSNRGVKLTETVEIEQSARDIVFINDPKSSMSSSGGVHTTEKACHHKLPSPFASTGTYASNIDSSPVSHTGPNATTSSTIRAPSPSDAAMMKPSEPALALAPLSNPDYANPSSATTFHAPPIAEFTPDREVTWPFRSHHGGENDLFAKQPLPFGEVFVGRSSSSNTESPEKRSSFVGIQNGDIVCGKMGRGSEGNNNYWESILDNHDRNPIRPYLEADKESPFNAQSPKMKRKAADISTADGWFEIWDENSTGETSIQRGKVDAAQPKAGFLDPISQVNNTSVPVEGNSDTQTSKAAVSERPKKRVKTSNSIAKYAAVALASAVVGSVGTIAALVSLPPDFFV